MARAFFSPSRGFAVLDDGRAACVNVDGLYTVKTGFRAAARRRNVFNIILNFKTIISHNRRRTGVEHCDSRRISACTSIGGITWYEYPIARYDFNFSIFNC